MSIDPSAYNITIRRVKIGDDLLFNGSVAELPDVATFESTYQEAYELVIDAIKSLYQASVDASRPFPPPLRDVEVQNYSGRITLRMPKWLHAQLDGQAVAEGISLNQYLISLLSAFGSINAVVSSAVKKIHVTSSAQPSYRIYRDLDLIGTGITALAGGAAPAGYALNIEAPQSEPYIRTLNS